MFLGSLIDGIFGGGGGGGGGGETQPLPPTPQEIALAETGAKEFNRYIDAFVPATADYIDATAAKDSDRLSLANALSGAVAKTTAGRGTDTSIVSSGLQAGYAPNSGRTVLGIDDASRAFAAGVAGGSASIRPQLLNREVAGVQKVVASGRGLADQSTAGLSAAGRASLADALSRADAAFADRRAELGLRQGVVSGLATAGGFAARNSGLTLDSARNQYQILSGQKYNTDPMSPQSFMLANQEWGF